VGELLGVPSCGLKWSRAGKRRGWLGGFFAPEQRIKGREKGSGVILGAPHREEEEERGGGFGARTAHVRGVCRLAERKRGSGRRCQAVRQGGQALGRGVWLDENVAWANCLDPSR
jgi:hypothetical protein